MPRPAPLPDELSEHAFTVAEGGAVGLSRMRMRASDLEHPFRGVRSARMLQTTRELAAAYAAIMPANQVFSHGTAAVLLGLRLPIGGADRRLHVTAAGEWTARVRGVVGHRSDAPIEYVVIDGLRVTTPVLTWCQLSAALPLDALIVTGDGLVSRRNALATMGELRSAIAFRSGARGVKRLREAFSHIRPGTDSPPETDLRLVLVRGGLPEPRVNVPILNRFGAVIAHGDLVYPAAKVVLEYEGDHHFENAEQYRIDIARLDDVMEEDFRVIRVDKHLLAAPPTLLRKIRDALARERAVSGALTTRLAAETARSRRSEVEKGRRA